MRHRLVPPPATALATVPPPPDLVALFSRAEGYSRETVSKSTRSGYAKDFARFVAWGEENRLPTLPSSPKVVAAYLAAMADGKVAVRWRARGGVERETRERKTLGTINRALSAIAFAHRQAGVDWPRAHPEIVRVMQGISRAIGAAPKKAAPLEVDDLRACLILCPNTKAGARDRALLSLGFFAALRRSELVALTVRDVEFCPEGVVLKIRKSKTDQTRKGQDVPVPFLKHARVCPVRLLRAWMASSGIESGPIFRRVDKAGNVGARALITQAVADIVKKLAAIAGLDPGRFSGHSLRAGFVTSAAAAGKSLHNIMRQTRHRSEHVAMGYIRYGTLWEQNAAADLA